MSRFAIEDAWNSKLLRDATFSLRRGKLLCGLKMLPISTDFYRFCNLNIRCLRINITLIFVSSSSNEFTLLLESSKTDVSVGFWPPYLHPSKGHQYGISIQSFINLGKTFSRMSYISNITQTWFLARLFVYLSSFISQILDFLYLMVCML